MAKSAGSLTLIVLAPRSLPTKGDVPIPATVNFVDPHEEMSVHIATETTPEKVLAGHEGFGLVSITVGEIRTICQGVPGFLNCCDEVEPADGHVLVCGKITPGLRKKLSTEAKWVRDCLPRRPLDEPGQLVPVDE